MSSVKIKTFTGREEDYLPGPNGPGEDIRYRDMHCDFSKVDRYYENVQKVPGAWKECWIDIENASYNRVVMFYNCHILTQDEVGREQRWHAMTVFMNDNDIVNLLLISETALLDQLWQDHRPNCYEFRSYLPTFDPEVKDKYYSYPVTHYLEHHNVEISTRHLRDETTVKGINNWTWYYGDREGLLEAVERELNIPQPGTLCPIQVQFFTGELECYVPNNPQPRIFRREGDFSAVDAYCAAQPLRPNAWHRLWTELWFGPILGAFNYDRVVMLKQGHFVSVDPDRGEQVWQSAAIFMRGDRLLNVLFIKTSAQLMDLCICHAPKNFEFTDGSIRGFAYQPLQGYLNGTLTGKKVELLMTDVGTTELRTIRFTMDQAGVNAFGVTLRRFILEKICPQ